MRTELFQPIDRQTKVCSAPNGFDLSADRASASFGTPDATRLHPGVLASMYAPIHSQASASWPQAMSIHFLRSLRLMFMIDSISFRNADSIPFTVTRYRCLLARVMAT